MIKKWIIKILNEIFYPIDVLEVVNVLVKAKEGLEYLEKIQDEFKQCDVLEKILNEKDILTGEIEAKDNIISKIYDLKVDSEKIVDYLIKTETEIKKGNGSEKLERVVNQYIKNHKSDIEEQIKDILAKKIQDEFDIHKEKINKLVMEKPICL